MTQPFNNLRINFIKLSKIKGILSGQPATLCLVNSGNVSVFMKFLIRRDEFCHDNRVSGKSLVYLQVR